MTEPSATLFRVDPRLVHATLVNAWVPNRGIRDLIVADREVLIDDRRRHIMEIAALDTHRVFFCGEEEVGRRLMEIESSSPAVLFSTLDAVERAMAEGLNIPVLNVGHVPSAPGRKEYLPSVFLGDDEIALIRRLQLSGVQVELRALPDDEPVYLEALTEESMRAEGEFEVVNERGLHLRAAHVLAALCNRLPNDVEVGREGLMVNAKSLLGLTALGAAVGTRLKVVVTGPQATSALDQLRALFARGFDEGVALGREGSG